MTNTPQERPDYTALGFIEDYDALHDPDDYDHPSVDRDGHVPLPAGLRRRVREFAESHGY